jgi:L-lysine exporter family protein LysE/ArgO
MTVLLQYDTVRWVLWIGGSVLLLYFAAKMVHSAIYHHAVLAEAGETRGNSPRQEFFRGIFLAMSSPSAILWFAAVGGTLIARSGGGTVLSSALFLGGFLSAGLLWSAGLCLAATQGGKLLGDKLLRYSYWASAAIFCYFAVYVIVSGYNEFVGKSATAILPGL